jgi:hypothetical protein
MGIDCPSSRRAERSKIQVIAVVKYDGISYIFTMKVTALIPDELVQEINTLAHGKNLTESLVIALREWRSIQKMRILKQKIKKSPLVFKNSFSAEKIRSLNRNR